MEGGYIGDYISRFQKNRFNLFSIQLICDVIGRARIEDTSTCVLRWSCFGVYQITYLMMRLSSYCVIWNPGLKFRNLNISFTVTLYYFLQLSASMLEKALEIHWVLDSWVPICIHILSNLCKRIGLIRKLLSLPVNLCPILNICIGTSYVVCERTFARLVHKISTWKY